MCQERKARRKNIYIFLNDKNYSLFFNSFDFDVNLNEKKSNFLLDKLTINLRTNKIKTFKFFVKTRHNNDEKKE